MERYLPLLPGVWYSSFPIIAACHEDRAGCLEVRAGCLKVSSQVASRSHVRVASRSQGTNFGTKIFNFRCFLALPTKMSFTTPHHYPKYEVWAIEFFCGRIPLTDLFASGGSGRPTHYLLLPSPPSLVSRANFCLGTFSGFLAQDFSTF